MGIFSRFRGSGAETGPYQAGVENKFSRDDVSRNAAETMPLDELKKLVEETRDRVDYEEKNNEADNEIVAYHRQQLQMLEDVLNSRTEKE